MTAVIDCDQHLYEARNLWGDHIDPAFRDAFGGSSPGCGTATRGLGDRDSRSDGPRVTGRAAIT
jgi:hypothetical protein